VPISEARTRARADGLRSITSENREHQQSQHRMHSAAPNFAPLGADTSYVVMLSGEFPTLSEPKITNDRLSLRLPDVYRIWRQGATFRNRENTAR